MADLYNTLGEKENSEFLETQIDRLNAALEEALNDIENNRSSIRIDNSEIMKSMCSVLTTEEAEDLSLQLEGQSQMYDSFYMQDDFEQKLEDLLIQLDRYQMIIEDFKGFEMQTLENSKHIKVVCTDLELLNSINQFKQAVSEKSIETLQATFGSVILDLDIQHEILSGYDILNENGDEIRNKEYLEKYIENLEKEIDDLKDKQVLCENLHGGVSRPHFEESPKHLPSKASHENRIDIDRLRTEITLELEMKYSKRKNPQLELAQEKLNLQLEEVEEIKTHYMNKLKELNDQKSSIIKRENELKSAKAAFEREKVSWREQMRVQEQETYKLKRHLEVFFKNYGYEDLSPGAQQAIPNGLEIDTSIDESFNPNSAKPQTPSYRFKQVAGLQGHLQELESKIKEYSETNEDPDKIELKIDNVKNKILNLRGEKAIYESKKQARSLAHMVKIMEKESSVNQEKRRKDLIQQIYKKYGIASKIILSPFNNARRPETPRARAFLFPIQEDTPENVSTSESPESSSKRPLPELRIPQDEKALTLLDKKADYLNQKENELYEKEKIFQDLCLKNPDSKDFFEIMKTEKEALEREKEVIKNEREHIKQIKEKLEDGNEKINKIKEDQLKERKLLDKEKKELYRLRKIIYSILPTLQMVSAHAV
ncbi:unnamed protein product [Blepharisma stoltei]|uniref:Uncharacterized protein n=1 Tax=Blepharisma stoltei TaxID=1481888 RepID=A0AAU9JVG5_9CILI|nr:unnamed protein product [Blepharisma stoltei]